jgi:5-methylcytosine-specific restriction protein B
MLAPILHFLGNSFSRHFHEDYDAISIYLTFKYPNKYIFYNYKALIQFLKYTEAKHLPDASDLEKYHQLINTIGVILSRDVELVGILDPLLDDHCYLGPSHLLAHDFIEYNIEDR